MGNSNYTGLPASVPLGTLSGTSTFIGADIAYQTGNPLAIGASVIFAYITAEAFNSMFDRKPLYQEAASRIKKRLNKIKSIR